MSVRHSVIVPIHNGSHFIHLFWTSLIPNLGSDTEVIIVDDGSTESIDLLVPKLPFASNHTLLRNERAQGYSSAVNRALRQAQGEYLYLLNTDLILGNGSLELIHDYLKRDQRVGIVGAKLLYPQTGRIQHFGVAFSRTRKFHAYTHMNPDHPLVSAPTEFQAVTFALCGFRREILDQIGPLDTLYCNGCEDIDFSLRVHKAGYRLVVPPEIASYHWESLSGEARHFLTLENEARFWGKWANEIVADIEIIVGRGLVHFLNEAPALRDRDFTIVNLSTGNDHLHIRAVINEHFHRSGSFDFWDYPRAKRLDNSIWLPMTLPIDAIRNPKPFLFIVQEYPQLMQNDYWFSQRKRFSSGDLIIDHYGNVETTAGSVSISLPARQKAVLDVS
jgi:GT2 family glycosyltransferase